MACTCNSGFRYLKGRPVPCPICNKDGKVINRASLVKIEGISEETREVVKIEEPPKTIEQILMIPDCYADKRYSRTVINSMLRGLTADRLFDKLDSLILNTRNGQIRQENCFFFAPQKFDLDLWAYTFLKESYEHGKSVLPYISLDVLWGIWLLTNDTPNIKPEVKESLDYMSESLNLTWYDLLLGDILVLKLPAVYNNKTLTILMSLVTQRVLHNKPTYLISYWKSAVVKKSTGGAFIFKEDENYGMNQFTIYEHLGFLDERKRV
jgi:hypothetical protein